MMRKFFALCLGLLFAQAVVAANLPYDEKADAKVDLQQALSQAKASHKQVLLVFGANWCPDCRELDKALHGTSAPLINGKFVLVKVDVGNFDKNLDVAQSYGNPIKKGIPAAVVLGADNKILYSTKAGELADARHMGENGIYDFFSKVVTTPK
ncbi:thioredoxin family protein [Collimonas arenae]|uniref:Thioredoxin family protein n=2 Tax=Collimonas arenae TaxID=279058 RepID=A0A127QGI3_9BURK|nr:thioredoxin family protein [Collimonas arenae]AMO99207.1 thioredoxin family protein [Collimonas arenae]AMP09104.1 thioredoxin family protein [Collimonas arenae]